MGIKETLELTQLKAEKSKHERLLTQILYCEKNVKNRLLKLPKTTKAPVVDFKCEPQALIMEKVDMIETSISKMKAIIDDNRNEMLRFKRTIQNRIDNYNQKIRALEKVINGG